ncbi:uncharacterized protein TNCV_4305571 [Trichonephila clavipes]|nr:uncharacterized protein TNCV_4305571 [Trichonephila clavipes]
MLQTSPYPESRSMMWLYNPKRLTRKHVCPLWCLRPEAVEILYGVQIKAIPEFWEKIRSSCAVTVDISRLPSKSCLVRLNEIGTRLFYEEEESISNSSHFEEESKEILKPKPLTLDEKLEKAIYSKTKILYCSTKKNNSFNKIMKQEMELFDSTENPSPNIIKLCEALKTIPLTSVEAERVFLRPDCSSQSLELE